MQKSRISIIAAIGKKRELGKNNDLIWRIPADLKRVKDLTTGHPIIMGWNTYQSIGRPLPNRTNIVIAQPPTPIEGCLVYESLEEGINAGMATGTDEIFIFGGASIYTEALPRVERLYLTLIDAEDTDADVFFPQYSVFSIISEEQHTEHVPAYSWQVLERRTENT